jgi:hypothetical protein
MPSALRQLQTRDFSPPPTGGIVFVFKPRSLAPAPSLPLYCDGWLTASMAKLLENRDKWLLDRGWRPPRRRRKNSGLMKSKPSVNQPGATKAA